MRIVFMGYSPIWPEKKIRAMTSIGKSGKMLRIGGTWRSYFFSLPFLWWKLFNLRPDIIVAQTVYHGLIAILLRPWAPLIVENHGDLPYRNKWIAKFVLRRAKAFRAVSRYTAGHFIEYGFYYDLTPIHIFPAWTDIDVFLDAYVKYKKPYEKVILYAGEIAHHKGVHILLKAFKQVLIKEPEAKLCIVGNCMDDEYMAFLREKAASIGSRVCFRHRVPQERLAKLMTQADVVVVPSLREGYGRVALEAMACGTPVVAHKVGGLPEIVEHAETGYLVRPGDSDMLSFWISEIVGKPSLEPREPVYSSFGILGIKGHKRARELFSTERYVDGYRRLFQCVI